MKVGDVVQVNLPFQKGAGVLIGKHSFDLPVSGESGHYHVIVNDYRWLVFYKGEMYDFHEHNLEVISDSG